ncbi:alpha-L-rhamnosidase-related protein [Mucilaginibacter myungsuensis]|uniref:Glycoside hydrolase n=1 Tax=Mucilaginibacter myungsuensis TaxID=649104 RepID=A0A929PYX4_9SPHI|nr:glycoside hydrolase [Mucilaginibacter myungsuensis]MBE9663905.1 glycoside hydrolase [Mucilaginibacter myungsuensis]MDN3598379.1 glycoside hydrolase [Mucilaginibacter myungsuensis]
MTSNFQRIVLAMICLLVTIGSSTNAQDLYATQRQGWLKKAEALKPALTETVKHPKGIVKLEKDPAAFQGWKAVPAGGIEQLYNASFDKRNSGIVVDFGEHLTGYCTFSLKTRRADMDAPLRLKLTFGEIPSELATPFDPYPGSLSRAWLQDETVTVSVLPATIIIPRRVAFRYVKIEWLGASRGFEFGFSDIQFKAVTSVTVTPPALAASTPDIIKDIDRVGLTTLKECMQTVYEDGPKRDRRLWIGDLYLEALANTYSFKNDSLTKRCLYLLAALSNPDGILNSNVFEAPEPHAQKSRLLDYCYLYNVALKEYVIATGDKQTGLDLWPVAKKQLDIARQYAGADGMMDYVKAGKEWWVFFDWKDGLDKQAPLQGSTIYALNQTYQLAKLLGKENEIADVPALSKKLKDAARKNLYDKTSGLFVSGTNKQASYGGQAWMVLSGVATKAEAQKALRTIVTHKDAVKPGGPYMYHYFVAALIETGMHAEAKTALTDYWGGMVNKGADTFWEVYDPADELRSPYNFYPMNSYCHAWSCTPVYFIRKYPEIFQR